MSVARRTGTVIALLIVTFHCRSGVETQSALQPSGELTLQDAGSFLLGGYTTFIARSAQGDTYVADQQFTRVVRFSPEGEPVRSYGRAGSGPGEFELVGAVGLVNGDSILVVSDVNGRTLTLFTSVTGDYLREIAVPAGDIGNDWAVDGDSITFALNLSPRLIAVWNWRADTLDLVGDTPPALRDAPDVAIRYGRPNAVRTPSTLLLQLPTEPWIRVLDLEGEALGRVTVPVAQRRGNPADLIARSRNRPRPQRFEPLGSLAAGLHRLSSGEVVVAYIDLDFVGAPANAGLGNFRLYLTLLSPDLAKACVDVRVPIDSDAPLYPAFRGDTVFALTRTVTDAGTVRSAVHGFLLRPSECEWQPTGGMDSTRNLAE